jgi:hypothetical protein
VFSPLTGGFFWDCYLIAAACLQDRQSDVFMALQLQIRYRRMHPSFEFVTFAASFLAVMMFGLPFIIGSLCL